MKDIHALWANVWAVIMYFYTSIHALLGSKGCNPTCTVVKVGGSLDQGSAAEVTHLGLNQPPVFSSASSKVCRDGMPKSMQTW